MQVGEHCKICKREIACDCRSAIVQYFTLLKNTHARVLREQRSSVVASTIPDYLAGIDKIDATFLTPIPCELIVSNAKRLGFDVKSTYLKDRRQYLMISRGQRFIHLKIGYNRTNLTSLNSNPNHFKSWRDYLKFIEELIPQTALRKASIFRLDLNLDFSCAYADLIQSIDVKNKRSSLRYENEGGIRTGIIVGKGNETIAIYDRSKRANLSTPCARLELRLKQKKLPTRSFYEISEVLVSQKFFRGIDGLKVVPKEQVLNNEKSNRLVEFNFRLRNDGYFSARRAMSSHGNFDRDFNQLIQVRKWSPELWELFQNGIRTFLENG